MLCVCRCAAAPVCAPQRPPEVIPHLPLSHTWRLKTCRHCRTLFQLCTTIVLPVWGTRVTGAVICWRAAILVCLSPPVCLSPHVQQCAWHCPLPSHTRVSTSLSVLALVTVLSAGILALSCDFCCGHQQAVSLSLPVGHRRQMRACCCCADKSCTGLTRCPGLCWFLLAI